MTEEIKVDTLVIGSGIAGLFFALRAARLGSVLVITKKERSDSNTNWAQGGIAAVLSPDDNYELHINDTLEAGAGLCNREAVEILVREGPEHVKELMAMGVQFTMKDGKPDLVREGGHSKHRILHVADFTGREIERTLLARAAEHSNIQIWEHHIAIELITEHHLRKKNKRHHMLRCICARYQNTAL
jgi:L-aspartate oxidase